MKKFFVLSFLTIFSFHALANDEAKRLTEQLMKDDIKTFKSGGDALLSGEVLTANASQLIKEYGNNQFKYESTYNNKLVHIKTVASGVKTDLSGDPYVVANGKNQFEYVSLKLKNKDDAMNINKGDKLDMICLGTKNNIMFPSLLKCVTTDNYLEQLLKTTINDFDNLKKDEKTDYYINAFYLAMSDVEPNSLSKYKSVNDLLKDKKEFDKIKELAKEKIKNKDEAKAYNLPKL